MIKNIRQSIAITVITTFIATSIHVPQAHAQGMPWMPKPGVRVGLSPAFVPAHLQGMVIHPDDALKFDFLIHQGEVPLSETAKKEEYQKLVQYFMASLTVPDDNQWVNLSPYEKNRIVEKDFGTTEMGRDLLAQDYLLKQMASSLMYPEEVLGKKFWNRVFERAQNELGTSNVPVNTINKVWIVPGKSTLFEKGDTVYILDTKLKVMMEEDYLALEKNSLSSQGVIAGGVKQSSTHDISSKVVREIIIPELEKEVNEGKNFAPLRQVYHSMLLAAWYKRALKESLLGKVYANRAKVKGVDLNNPATNDEIYQQYLKAFKKGVFNYIKEDVDRLTKEQMPRKYFSGGTTGISDAVYQNDVAVVSGVPAEFAEPARKTLGKIDRAVVAVQTNDSAMTNPKWVKSFNIRVIKPAAGDSTIQRFASRLVEAYRNDSSRPVGGMFNQTWVVIGGSSALMGDSSDAERRVVEDFSERVRGDKKVRGRLALTRDEFINQLRLERNIRGIEVQGEFNGMIYTVTDPEATFEQVLTSARRDAAMAINDAAMNSGRSAAQANRDWEATFEKEVSQEFSWMVVAKYDVAWKAYHAALLETSMDFTLHGDQDQAEGFKRLYVTLLGLGYREDVIAAVVDAFEKVAIEEGVADVAEARKRLRDSDKAIEDGVAALLNQLRSLSANYFQWERGLFVPGALKVWVNEVRKKEIVSDIGRRFNQDGGIRLRITNENDEANKYEALNNYLKESGLPQVANLLMPRLLWVEDASKRGGDLGNGVEEVEYNVTYVNDRAMTTQQMQEGITASFKGWGKERRGKFSKEEFENYLSNSIPGARVIRFFKQWPEEYYWSHNYPGDSESYWRVEVGDQSFLLPEPKSSGEYQNSRYGKESGQSFGRFIWEFEGKAILLKRNGMGWEVDKALTVMPLGVIDLNAANGSTDAAMLSRLEKLSLGASLALVLTAGSLTARAQAFENAGRASSTNTVSASETKDPAKIYTDRNLLRSFVYDAKDAVYFNKEGKWFVTYGPRGFRYHDKDWTTPKEVKAPSARAREVAATETDFLNAPWAAALPSTSDLIKRFDRSIDAKLLLPMGNSKTGEPVQTVGERNFEILFGLRDKVFLADSEQPSSPVNMDTGKFLDQAINESVGEDPTYTVAYGLYTTIWTVLKNDFRVERVSKGKNGKNTYKIVLKKGHSADKYKLGTKSSADKPTVPIMTFDTEGNQITGDPLGGIDLNAANADIQIKRDGNGVPLPLSQQNMEMLMKIDGFVPVIIDIKPIIDLPLFGQLKNQFTATTSNAVASATKIH